MKNEKYEEYIFSSTVKIQGSKYIYQHVKSRTLTDLPHYHNFYEICYVIRGGCNQIYNGKSFYIWEGTMSVVIPGGYHYFTSQTDDLILICLSVEQNEFRKIAHVISPDVLSFLNDASDKQIFSIFGNPPSTLHKNPYLNNQNDLDYKHLLSFFMVNIEKNRIMISKSTPHSFVNMINSLPALELIQGGTEKLTELSNYSRTQLTRLMKKHFDKTPWEYVTELRMNYAYNRLAFTDMNIEDISERCGFDSFSHFSQSFKKWFNETPSAIRKKHLNNTI